MDDPVSILRSRFDTAEEVWFFVKPNYRILHYNKKAASNSIAFHNKAIAPGDSILDYARDTNNRIDGEFITCFGKSAAGHIIKHEQQVIFKENTIWTRATYSPVYEHGKLLGISIIVEDITQSKTTGST